jgi:hypothetical protein
MQRKLYAMLQREYLQAQEAILEARRHRSLAREQVKLSLEAIGHSRELLKRVDDTLAEDARDDRHG